VARVAALIPDLLFGSKVQGVLAQDGHDVVLVAAPEAAVRDGLGGADVVLIDLAGPGVDGCAVLEALRRAGALAGVRTVATYSHVDADMRRRALEAGFDLVVPRSRLMREGAGLLAEPAGA
jgi:CheY-like chemotaxis protein